MKFLVSYNYRSSVAGSPIIPDDAVIDIECTNPSSLTLEDIGLLNHAIVWKLVGESKECLRVSLVWFYPIREDSR